MHVQNERSPSYLFILIIIGVNDAATSTQQQKEEGCSQPHQFNTIDQNYSEN